MASVLNELSSTAIPGIEVKRVPAPVVEINAPGWFSDPAFIEAISSSNVMTWHPAGEEPGVFSDVVVWLDPSLNGEGSDQGNLPNDKWDAIVTACRQVVPPCQSVHHIIVRITNMEIG